MDSDHRNRDRSTANRSTAQAQWILFTFLLVAAVVLIALNVMVRSESDDAPVDPAKFKPPPLSFDGPSTGLSTTAVQLTLETPIPAGKTAIWCGTFAMAWHELADQIVKEPIDLQGASELARLLNRSSAGEIEEKDRYAAAGWYADGILDKIRREFATRFPNSPVPKLTEGSEGGVVFAYLEVKQPYTYELKQSDVPMRFKDSAGGSTDVRAFGIMEDDKDQGEHTFRGQVSILYRDKEGFAVDLCSSSRPYQIVLARMPSQETLQKCLDYLGRKTTDRPEKHLSSRSILLVPEMHWKVEHDFQELEGKSFANGGLRGRTLVKAWQFINFRLDHKGAMLSSGASIEWDNGHEIDQDPNRFVFDGPFLLVLRKRGSPQPFFVVWIDNAELLRRANAP